MIRHEFAELIRGVWKDLRGEFRSLLIYYLFFMVLLAVVLIPLTTWGLSSLISTTGELSVTNLEILSFLLSLKGILFLLVAGILWAALLFAEHAGMILIVWESRHGRRLTPVRALWIILRRIHGLLALGAYHMAAHLLLLTPFLAMGACTYLFLLSSYDPYYLVKETPPVWWVSLGIAALLAVGILIVNGRLYLRWMFSLHAFLLEGASPRAALKRSRALSRKIGRRTVMVILGSMLLLAALPGLLTFLFDILGLAIFTWLPLKFSFVIPAVLTFMALYLMLSVGAVFLGVAGNGLIITRLYAGLPGISAGEITTTSSPRGARPLGWGLAALALLIALAASWSVLRGFDFEDRVEITAHRGSSLHAPENTLSAISRAIEDGAHYAEIDVQETADGRLVLIHDKDLLRIAGLNRNIWDVRYDEIKDLDIGSWFSPEFNKERIPLLSQAIALARDRIKLNIELKYNGHDKRLAERAVEIIQEEKFASQCIITSNQYSGLQLVRKLDRSFKIGFIVFQSIGRIEGRDVDLLSVASGLVDADLMHRIHRAGKEVHVWTVNRPGEMARFIDLGADNLITDRPAEARELLRDRADSSAEELLLGKVRSWFLR